MRLPTKYSFQKKYVAFLAIVPLLVVTTLVKVDCPICDGHGLVNSTPSMEKVQIIESEGKELYVTRTACGPFIVYQYDVMVSLLNEGSDEAEGWLRMIHKDMLKDKVLDTQYVAVSIPGETLLDMTYTVWFGAGYEAPGRTEVCVEVIVGEVPDLVCNGTGKIPLNTLFLTNWLKDSFDEIVRVEQEYKPPLAIPWEEYAGEAN